MEFKAWPKTPRLNKPVEFTEKLDGTNGCVVISEDLEVMAQSRNRIITPKDDNYGFAGWVQEHAEDLAAVLGPGYHYGEWWGHGIQRGYGLPKGDRRFSLFNINRYEGIEEETEYGLGIVPFLGTGDIFNAYFIMHQLTQNGSKAVQGYMNPEGIIAYHTASRRVYKYFPEDLVI